MYITAREDNACCIFELIMKYIYKNCEIVVYKYTS